VPITDKEIAEKLLKMTDMLEELDDVQEVYSNADIAEAVLAEIE
jgi:transcriptional/translational regulatory protein YebC/TACO1